MAAKKKSTPNPVNNSNKNYSLADFKNPVKPKPTEAITKPGQKATGLAKSNISDRFSSTAKTPVRNDISGMTLRGSGTPLGTSIGMNPLNKGQIVNAALTALSAPRAGVMGAETVTRNVVKKVAGRYGGAAAEGAGSSAFGEAAKGLNVSGMGGKIKVAQGVKGPVNVSTKVGSIAEQGARMGNLTKRASNIAGAAASGGYSGAAGKIISDFSKGATAVSGATQAGAVAGLAAQAKSKSKKKK